MNGEGGHDGPGPAGNPAQFRHPCYDHFHYDYDNCLWRCKVGLCTKIFVSPHAGNMAKHLASNHKNVVPPVACNPMKRKPETVPQHEPNKRTCLNGVDINANTIKDALVELVAVNGRPYSIANDSGLRRIIDPLIHAMPERERYVFSNQTLPIYVADAAKKARQRITAEVENRMISLKIDAASRLHRSFLGINAQFISQDENSHSRLQLRTLAVKRLTQPHSGEYLHRIVRDVLSDYAINVRNVYSVTTDNGANMISAVRQMNRDQEDAVVDELLEEFEADPDTFSHDSILYMDAAKMFTSSNVRCAAHTEQLAVDDAMEAEHGVLQLLEKVRIAVKKLRTQNIINVISSRKLPKPVLDNDTRWHSTLDMLICINELRRFISEFSVTVPEFVFSDDEWNAIDEVIEALTPSKICTKKLQEQQLLPGGMLEAWLQCVANKKAVGTPLANLIVTEMAVRQDSILDNEAIRAGLFLDPRYKSYMGQREQEATIEHLVMLHDRMEELDGRPCAPAGEANPDDEQGGDEPDSVELLLREAEQRSAASSRPRSSRGRASRQRTPAPPHTARDIRTLLKNWAAVERVRDRTIDVLEWWDARKKDMPELYKLALVALAVPATQVSVERLFSGMKFILHPQRSSLGEEDLDNILVIRCNKLFQKTS